MKWFKNYKEEKCRRDEILNKEKNGDLVPVNVYLGDSGRFLMDPSQVVDIMVTWLNKHPEYKEKIKSVML